MAYPSRRIAAQCPTCGKDYTYIPSSPRQHCSKACLPSARLTTTCPECGIEFWYYRSWPRKYCSNVCSGKNTVSNLPNFTPARYTTQCEQCGQSYETTPKATRGRFCSRRCYGAWLSIHQHGAAHPRHGKKAPRPHRLVSLMCALCSKPFLAKPSHLTRRRFCSKACHGAWRTATGAFSGANSPTWTGGHDPYYGPSWHPAKRAVRLRDPICQRCGILPETAGQALDVHHLIPFRAFGVERHAEANALSNLIALCRDCHQIFEWQTNRSDAHLVRVS